MWLIHYWKRDYSLVIKKWFQLHPTTFTASPCSVKISQPQCDLWPYTTLADTTTLPRQSRQIRCLGPDHMTHSLGVSPWRSCSTHYSWGVLFLSAGCLSQWFLLLINHIGFHWAGVEIHRVSFCRGHGEKVVPCSQVRLVWEASFDYTYTHMHFYLPLLQH